MFKRALLASAIAVSSSAQAYIFEGTYGYTDGESTPSINGRQQPSTSTDSHTLDINVYLKEIAISKGAWREAAFLNKASSVNAHITHWSFDEHGSNDNREPFAFGLGGRAVTQSNYIFEADVSRGKFEDTKTLNTTFGFGAYLNEKNAVVGRVTYGTNKDFADFADASDGWTDVTMEANYHGVHDIGSSDQTIALDASWVVSIASTDTVDTDKVSGWLTGFDLSPTYYPIQPLGIGARLSYKVGKLIYSRDNDKYEDDNNINRLNTNLFVDWFPIEQVRLGIAYNYYSYSEKDRLNKGEVTYDNVELNLGVRF